ncbi:hypothetical protein E2C01_054034 [Portunus trituberculatus]|uniref:Uncharacterized protein n=1 Tax=Portunus trituberculatus TaxID=210409 RepID=A0A5B7GQY4_PORTR|nr:hypothetical protein [Portunus trituberculatus]
MSRGPLRQVSRPRLPFSTPILSPSTPQHLLRRSFTPSLSRDHNNDSRPFIETPPLQIITARLGH